MELTANEIEKNLADVRARVAEACAKAGRDPKDVQILAVSKTKPMEDIRAAMSVGQHAFGENYVQEIDRKYAELGDQVEWHMIGHLQRNKVKYIIDKVRMIHSVDTIALAQQIEKEAEKHGVTMDVLLEVNIAEEATKWGFTAEEAPAAAKTIGAMPHIRVRGLMTSAPYTEDAETNRVHFRNLRLLAEKIRGENDPGVVMDTLSMGMTADYTVAVEEGATIVRVGTAIFGARNYAEN